MLNPGPFSLPAHAEVASQELNVVNFHHPRGKNLALLSQEKAKCIEPWSDPRDPELGSLCI